MKPTVCVIGLGYIGLPTASFLGTKGYCVLGVDIVKAVVDSVNQGKVETPEPDLDILVKSAIQSGNLSADLKPAEADIFIIAVPTPLQADHTPDLSAIQQAVDVMTPHIRPGNLVILESTSPVGTTEHLVAGRLKENGFDVEQEVLVAHCPERVLPGRILAELVQNDRIVGGVTPAATTAAAAFYREFVNGEVLETTAATAELVKLAENTFRDVNIAFANELSMICDEAGVDVWEAIRLANRHPRVNILNPGPGVGGHCIAVDPWFLHAAAPEQAGLIRVARHVNDAKPDWVIKRLRDKAAKFKRPVIACLGLTFKADVDDTRESPALAIVRRIREEDLGDILVCEPNLQNSNEFELVSLDRAVAEADIILLLVDHRSFKDIPRAKLEEKILIDTRGILR